MTAINDLKGPCKTDSAALRRASCGPRLRAASVCAALLAGVAVAQAQEETTATRGTQPTLPQTAREAVREERVPGLGFLLRPEGSVTFKSDLDDDAGSVAVYRAGATFSVASPLTSALTLGFDVRGEWSHYDFDDPAFAFGSEDPFSDVYDVLLGPTASYKIDDRWSVAVTAFGRFSGEGGVDVGDALTGGGTASARYKFSDSLALSFGVGGASRLEDDPRFIPVVGVEWQITDKLRLESRGPGLELSAAVAPAIEVTLDGRWEPREYRLEDDGPIPDGVVQDERVPIAAGVRWKPSTRFNLWLRGGAIVWQEFEFKDSNGDEVQELNTDPAPFISLQAIIRF